MQSALASKRYDIIVYSVIINKCCIIICINNKHINTTSMYYSDLPCSLNSDNAHRSSYNSSRFLSVGLSFPLCLVDVPCSSPPSIIHYQLRCCPSTLLQSSFISLPRYNRPRHSYHSSLLIFSLSTCPYHFNQYILSCTTLGVSPTFVVPLKGHCI